jgi:hypothetical protein
MSNYGAKVAIAGLLALGMAACGGGVLGNAHNAPVISNAQNAAVNQRSIEQAFLRLPGARTDNLGMVEYLAPGEDRSDLSVNAGCSVNVILTSPSEIALYKGDSVVTNSGKTAGAKITGTAQSEVACLAEAADVLKTVK